MHTDIGVDPRATAIVASAQARGVPVISARQLLNWVDARNGSTFGNMTWDGYQLRFAVAAPAAARGLQALLPATAATGALTGLRRDGNPIPFALTTIKGVSYAVFGAGTGAYVVEYGIDTAAPVVTNVAASATQTDAIVTWTTNEPAGSRVEYRYRGQQPDVRAFGVRAVDLAQRGPARAGERDDLLLPGGVDRRWRPDWGRPGAELHDRHDSDRLHGDRHDGGRLLGRHDVVGDPGRQRSWW